MICCKQVESVYLQQERRIYLTSTNLSSMIGELCEELYEKLMDNDMSCEAAEASLKSLEDALAVVATFLAR
jgi:hypothetical protein